MMPKCKMLRQRAYAALQSDLFSGVWMTLLLCGIIAGAITSAPGSFSSGAGKNAVVAVLAGIPAVVASILLGGPFSYALARMYDKVAKGEKIKIPEIFIGFKENYGGTVMLAFMQSLFLFLWTMLFIIPGIIKSYAYSMAYFIRQDSKGEKQWRACIDESIEMMRGYKGKLFLLDLSFIGWYIVGFLCLGVGVLWVSTYHKEARAQFYEELKKIKYGPADEDNDPPGDPIIPETIVADESDFTVSDAAKAETAPDRKDEVKNLPDEE